MRRRIWAAVMLGALGIGGAALGGCSSKKKAPSPSASTSVKANSLPPKVDAALFKTLTDIARACKVEAADGSVTCPQGENRRLIAEFVSNQRPRPASVPTLTAALSDPNPALQAAAANLLNGAFRSPWGQDAKPGSVQAVDAKALLAAALKAPKALARQALPGAVHASLLAGQTDDLYASLDRADQTELRPLGYRYVMTHGRLSTFGKVQQLAKDNNSSLAFAALEAPRNMYDWDEAEKAAICPWAAGLLQDPRPNVATRAAGLLSSCTGAFVDQLLDRGENALKAGQFSAAELGAFRDLCSAANRREAGGVTEKQCDRNRELLGDVISNKKLDAQTRSMALVSLAYQWPDEKTLKLARSLERDADKSLAEHAARTIKRLEQRKATEKGAAAKPVAAADKKPPARAVNPPAEPAAPPAP